MADDSIQSISATLSTTSRPSRHTALLAIGTANGEFALGATQISDPVTPTNVKITPQTTFGSATDVKPLRVGSVILFLQRAGRKLREYAYQFDTDSFVAPNMTVLAEHVTPFNNALQMPNVTGIINLQTDAGRAMMDAILYAQAQIISFSQDFELVTLVTLCAIPLAMMIGSSRRNKASKPQRIFPARSLPFYLAADMSLMKNARLHLWKPSLVSWRI